MLTKIYTVQWAEEKLPCSIARRRVWEFSIICDLHTDKHLVTSCVYSPASELN